MGPLYSILSSIASIVCLGFSGHSKIMQNPASLLASLLLSSLKQVLHARLSSSLSLRRSLTTLSSIFQPMMQVPISLDGFHRMLQIFSAKNMNSFPLHPLSALFLSSYWISSSVFSVVPAGDSSTSLFTLFPYVSVQHAAMYPPKLWPTIVNSSIPILSLQAYIALTKQFLASSYVNFSSKPPLEELPIPNVSRACTWQCSLRDLNRRTQVIAVPPNPWSSTICGNYFFLGIVNIQCMWSDSKIFTARQSISSGTARREKARAFIRTSVTSELQTVLLSNTRSSTTGFIRK